MKRKNEEPQPPARRSARTRAEPQRFGVSVEEDAPAPVPLPKQPRDHEVASVHAYNSHATHHSARTSLRQYNLLLNFLPNSAAAQLQSEIATIDDPSKKLRDILRKAYEEAKVEEHRILEQEEELRAFVLTDKRWYERGDILALNLVRLEQMLSDPTIDVESFSKVARSSVVTAFAEVRHWDHMEDSLLLEKTICLLDALRDAHAPASMYHAFHFCILLVTEALRPHQASLWRHETFDHLWDTCDSYIRMCAKPNTADEQTNLIRVQDTYFNFAEARRQLWVAWMDVHCLDIDTYESDDEGYESTCFHVRNLYPLQNIQKQAHAEVRAGVMLAVGHRLPVELADEIFEFALAAEELPLDWSVLNGSMIADEYRCPWAYD